MKKQSTLAVILWLAAAAALAETAQFTAPKAGETWVLGSQQKIAWTWSGAGKVKLLLYDGAQAKVGTIQSNVTLNAGSCAWTVGAMEGGKAPGAGGGYTVRMARMADNTLLATSPAFALATTAAPAVKMEYLVVSQTITVPPAAPATSITVTRPKKGEVWIPLKPFAAEWDWNGGSLSINKYCQTNSQCLGCQVDLWLVPVNPALGPGAQLASHVCSGATLKNSQLVVGGAFQGLVPAMPSGEYVLRVLVSTNPGFRGDSAPITVQSVFSNDTALLGPDPLQGEADLALTNLFFDGGGNTVMRIKNLGPPYNGKLPYTYQTQFLGSGNISEQKGEPLFQAAPGETKDLIIAYWHGYEFSDTVYDKGHFIPLTTRPFKATLKISPEHDCNSTNDAIVQKLMCFIHDADIGTGGKIRLDFSPQGSWIYIDRGTSNQIHESEMKWIAPKTFEAELEVDLWNYGCSTRTFDVWLNADKLPGQAILKGVTLPPGDKKTFKQKVQVTLPNRCGNHSLILTADPAEQKNTPYPDSYFNNVIPVTLKIVCGGTVTGNGS